MDKKAAFTEELLAEITEATAKAHLTEMNKNAEANMVDSGVDRYRNDKSLAIQHGRESYHGAGVVILSASMQKMVAAIKFQTDGRKNGRPCKVKADLKLIPANELALIVVRTVHDELRKEKPLGSTLITIGRHVEMELKLRHFKRSCRSQPKLDEKTGEVLRDKNNKIIRSATDKSFKNAMKQANRRQKVEQRIKVVSGIQKQNTKIPPWIPWTTKRKGDLGAKLFQLMRETTGTVDKVFNVSANRYELMATPEFEALTADIDCRLEMLQPMYKPLVNPPMPWTNAMQGGYWTLPCSLVKDRSSAQQGDQNVDPSPIVLRAINAVQETSWKVNELVLETIVGVRELGQVDLPKFPADEDLREPQRPGWLKRSDKKDDFSGEKLKLYLEYYAARAKYHRKDKKRKGRRRTAYQALNLAKELVDQNKIYFPHQLCWRGRMYPTCTSLSPQGSDLSRSLIHFHEGKALSTPRAQEIFVTTGASFYGIDKVGYQERIDFIFEHTEEIMEVYDDPISNRWWMNDEVEKPYQFLAFCLEFGEWEDGGNSHDFVSHMVCSFDATCSGLQVFSALGRDEVGAASVNLLPADVPQDIYANVAKEVIKRVEADVVKVAIPGSTKDDKRRLKADAKLARELLKAGLIDRTMCKKPVMTKVYDSTPWGQQRMLEELLDDMEEDGKDLKLEDVTTTVRYLAPIIFDAIYDSVIGASEIMNWFKECAGLASDVNGAIEWQTPVKFKVRQKYMTTSQDSFRTMIDGEIKVKFLKQLRKMHKGDNKAAISANAIHSYDSAHLVLTVDTMTHDMEEIGETPSWSVVHDQFGSHAQDGERLALTLREQFVEMYEMHDPLMDFKESVEAALQIELPDPPAKGGLDIRQVLESSFFFH